MTREQQIRKYAEEKCILYDSIGFDGDIYSLITETVKWTDENPKRYSQEELCDIQLEMMKQRDKRLLDKVIKVLKNNIDLWTNTQQSIFSNYQEVYFLDNFEEDFRKMMKE